MTIQDNTLFADEDMHLVRIADGINFGRSIALGYTYYLNGELLDTPHLEVAEDFTEVSD